MKDTLMYKRKSNLKRMSQIQKNLITFVKSELKTDDDHLYVATMLLKHSIALYKTILDDQELADMLDHVIQTLHQDYPEIELTTRKTIH